MAKKKKTKKTTNKITKAQQRRIDKVKEETETIKWHVKCCEDAELLFNYIIYKESICGGSGEIVDKALQLKTHFKNTSFRLHMDICNNEYLLSRNKIK